LQPLINDFRPEINLLLETFIFMIVKLIDHKIVLKEVHQVRIRQEVNEEFLLVFI